MTPTTDLVPVPSPTPTVSSPRFSTKLRRLAGITIGLIALLGAVASFLPGRQLTPLEEFVKHEQTKYDTTKAAYLTAERALVFRKMEWYLAKLQSGEKLTPAEAQDYARLQERSLQVESSLLPVARAASWRFSDDAAANLDAFFAAQGSPLAGNAAAILWAAETHDVKQVTLWIGKMKSESHYCKDTAKAIEVEYHNCGGLKIRGADWDTYWAAHPELIRNGKRGLPDANGSYLRKFDSYSDYFNESARLWATSYDHLSPSAIASRWVGRSASGWLRTAQGEARKIHPLITPPPPTT